MVIVFYFFIVKKTRAGWRLLTKRKKRIFEYDFYEKDTFKYKYLERVSAI